MPRRTRLIETAKSLLHFNLEIERSSQIGICQLAIRSNIECQSLMTPSAPYKLVAAIVISSPLNILVTSGN